MPYIKQEDKDAINIGDRGPQTPGELNYAITRLCRNYFRFNGQTYQQINDVLGALDGCAREFYRRIAVPYEDGKIKENGDVY